MFILFNHAWSKDVCQKCLYKIVFNVVTVWTNVYWVTIHPNFNLYRLTNVYRYMGELLNLVYFLSGDMLVLLAFPWVTSFLPRKPAPRMTSFLLTLEVTHPTLYKHWVIPFHVFKTLFSKNIFYTFSFDRLTYVISSHHQLVLFKTG